MASWARARVREHKLAIATIVASLLLWLIASTASAGPLVISNVDSGNIGNTSATITWATDLQANSTVNYGNTTDLGTIVTDSDFVFNHSINLTGLDSATVYYYQVSSTDQDGNTTTDIIRNFTTDPYYPSITGISHGNVTDTSAIITWTTDRLADSTVNYGNSTSLGSTESNSDFVLGHSITLTGLTPSTQYYYEVSSTNQYGNTTVDNNSGAYYTFTTGLAPPTISGVTVSNIIDTAATITWTTNQQSTSTVDYGNTTALGSTTSDGNLTYNHTINLTGLSPNTLYYYQVSSTNAEGRTAVSPGNNTYYTFKTAVLLDLNGWGWSTNYGQVATATLNGYVILNERANAPKSLALHAWGNLTLQPPGASAEIIPVDMYGSRIRSLFYLRQEVTGESSTFTGTWIDSPDGQSTYIMTSGLIALPNPEGQSFKTARLCFVLLRAEDVTVPLEPPADTFAANLDYAIAWLTKYTDRLLDALVGTGVGQILSEILAKIMILLASIRALGTPYFP
jgi:hypothetical protein